jgi:hypothetical protein
MKSPACLSVCVCVCVSVCRYECPPLITFEPTGGYAGAAIQDDLDAGIFNPIYSTILK